MILGVIAFLVVAAIAVCIPGFIGLAKCGSFGAAYTGCLVGTKCACNVTQTDAAGKQTSRCVDTTSKGCYGLGLKGKTIALWAGDATTQTCMTSKCTTAAA